MSFRNLDPQFAPWARWLYDVAQYYGLRPRVTSGFRSRAEQARLYAAYQRGETRYPAAPPGYSLHEYGLAIDMVSEDPAFLARVWGGVGGRWGGSRDPVHYSA